MISLAVLTRDSIRLEPPHANQPGASASQKEAMKTRSKEPISRRGRLPSLPGPGLSERIQARAIWSFSTPIYTYLQLKRPKAPPGKCPWDS